MINPDYAQNPLLGLAGVKECKRLIASVDNFCASRSGMVGVGQNALYDLATQVRVNHPVFSDPVIWSKPVTVPARTAVEVNFTLEQRTWQMPQGH